MSVTGAKGVRHNFNLYGGTGGWELLDSSDEGLGRTVSVEIELLGAERIEPGEYKIVAAPRVTGTIVHESFGHGVETDVFLKERARASQYIGKSIGSPLVNIWTLRHFVSRGSQLYVVPGAVEAERDVSNERYVIDVLRDTTAGRGAPSVGPSSLTLLPDADIDAAIDAAALYAGLVHNRPYGLPGPAVLPDVLLLDETPRDDMCGALAATHLRLRDAVGEQTDVRMTAAELFAERETVRLRNSRGIDAM